MSERDRVFRAYRQRDRATAGGEACGRKERAIVGKAFELHEENEIRGRVRRRAQFRFAKKSPQPVESDGGGDGEDFHGLEAEKFFHVVANPLFVIRLPPALFSKLSGLASADNGSF